MAEGDATRLAVLIDSDNTTASLTTELLEGMTVYGFGRRNTPEPFVAACDRFIYLDRLGHEPQGGEQPAPRVPKLKGILSTAISNTAKDDGWSHLAEVGSYLVKSDAAFDPRDYGSTKLGALVRNQPYVDVKDVPGPTGLSQLWVRLNPKDARPR